MEVARAIAARLRGLIGRDGWGDADGLLIEPCNGVHTFFLRFSIDVVFLDAKGVVVAVERLRPYRLGRIHPRARSALELPEGAADRYEICPGDQVRFSSAPNDAPDNDAPDN